MNAKRMVMKNLKGITALKELRDKFAMAIYLHEAEWAGQSEPTVEQTKQTLGMVQDFLTKANQILSAETDQWKAEFQSALQQADDFAKSQPKKDEVKKAVNT